MRLFRDRNFSLANTAIAAVGFTVTAQSLPLVFYYQLVLGFSPTRAALQLVPMAVVSGSLAPLAGQLVDRVHPRILATFGLLVMAATLFWYAAWLVPDETLWWRLLFPSALMGVAAAFTYGPLSTTATFNLPVSDAGAGAGVYNSVRQVGAVLGSAAIAALMESQLAARLPGGSAAGAAAESVGRLPASLQAGFAEAMANSVMLPAGVAVLGACFTLFFAARDARVPWTAANVHPGQSAASQGALGLGPSNASADSEVPR